MVGEDGVEVVLKGSYAGWRDSPSLGCELRGGGVLIGSWGV